MVYFLERELDIEITASHVPHAAESDNATAKYVFSAFRRGWAPALHVLTLFTLTGPHRNAKIDGECRLNGMLIWDGES